MEIVKTAVVIAMLIMTSCKPTHEPGATSQVHEVAERRLPDSQAQLVQALLYRSFAIRKGLVEVWGSGNASFDSIDTEWLNRVLRDSHAGTLSRAQVTKLDQSLQQLDLSRLQITASNCDILLMKLFTLQNAHTRGLSGVSELRCKSSDDGAETSLDVEKYVMTVNSVFGERTRRLVFAGAADTPFRELRNKTFRDRFEFYDWLTNSREARKMDLFYTASFARPPGLTLSDDNRFLTIHGGKACDAMSWFSALDNNKMRSIAYLWARHGDKTYVLCEGEEHLRFMTTPDNMRDDLDLWPVKSLAECVVERRESAQVSAQCQGRVK